jgi:formylglycine-generating enzyme required for sulfatase activity
LFESLLPEEQVTAKRILLQIVRPSEGLEVTRNRVPRKSLYIGGEASDRIDRVLDKLVQSRLVHLTKGEISDEDQVEVAHEALVRNWPRLVEWLEDERVTLRRRQRLTTQSEQWNARGQKTDDSVLLRGWLLDEAKNFTNLSELEAAFVQASETAVRKAKEQEEDRRQRELSQAQELARRAELIADEQKARADAQKRLIIALVILFAITVGGLVIGYNIRQRQAELVQQQTELELAALGADATIRAQEIAEAALMAEQQTKQAELATIAVAQATTDAQIAISQAEAATRSIVEATKVAENVAATATVQRGIIVAEATQTAQAAQATTNASALTPTSVRPTATPEPAVLIMQFNQTAQLDSFIREKDNMPVLFVTGGAFDMGEDEEGLNGRSVAIEDFYIDQYEVSARQFASFLNSIGGYENMCGGFDCALTGFETQYTYLLNNFGIIEPKVGGESFPVNWVSWYGGNDYCHWVGGRLPTEAEWEYAARAVDGRIYPWGPAQPNANLAIFGGSRNAASFFAAFKPADALPAGASPFGAYNMAGSVREWVEDAPAENDQHRILRGGSWIQSAQSLYTYSRESMPAEMSNADIIALAYWDVGFRCVMTAKP